MEQPEFMKLQTKDCIKDIRDKYNITSKIYVSIDFCNLEVGQRNLSCK